MQRGIKCVLDNASMHNVAWLSAILFAVGIDVLCPPNYHPEWNPIELVWKAIKSRLSEADRGHDATARKCTSPRRCAGTLFGAPTPSLLSAALVKKMIYRLRL